MFKKETNTFMNISMFIVVLSIVFYILKVGASLIIPFIIALLLSLAIIGLSNFYKKFKLPAFISFPLSLITYGLIFYMIGTLINSNIEDLINKLPDYQEKVGTIITSVFEYLHLSEPTNINEIMQKMNLTKIFSTTFSAITSLFSSAGIILFYVLFILLEHRYFSNKLQLMIKDGIQKKYVLDTINKIKTDVKSYFVIKSIVSLITATLSYSVMIAFGLDFAIFWAFVVFVLNFIPSVGSIIAVSFPVMLSLIQFESYYPFMFITGGLVGVQILMGNIIEPKFMGNKLNLSPLVIIISLGFWGSLWGIVGMLLSVPIMVIINIILAKIPVTRPIAILLSEKGELQVEGGEEVEKTRKRLLKKVKDKLSVNHN